MSTVRALRKAIGVRNSAIVMSTARIVGRAAHAKPSVQRSSARVSLPGASVTQIFARPVALTKLCVFVRTVAASWLTVL
jgi:hypothetical protein